MRTEEEIKQRYNDVLKELEREPSSWLNPLVQRTKGYLEALMWVLGEE